MVCMYKTQLRSVSGAHAHAMAGISTEGTRVGAMVILWEHQAGISNVLLQADVGAVKRFKMVVLPRNDEGSLRLT